MTHHAPTLAATDMAPLVAGTALCDGEVHLWRVPIGGAVERARLDISLLDDAERAHARRIRSPADRLRFVAGRVMVRRVLGAYLDLAPETVVVSHRCRHCGCERGKPRVTTIGPAPSFSLSHSGRWVGVAVAHAEVGLDIEAARPALYGPELAATVLATSELAAFGRTAPADRPPAFLRYWTRKEAILKATGHGLSVAPADVVVSPPGEAPRLLDWTADHPRPPAVQLVDIDLDESHTGCIAVLSTTPVRLRAMPAGDPFGEAR